MLRDDTKNNNSRTLKYIEHPMIRENSIESRLYQINIVNSSKDKNTMVILPTSLGKTVISALLCADILYNYKNTRILVMAPTRPLVFQHMISFSSMLKVLKDQKILVTGKIPPSLRKLVWDNNQIKLIFATPEIIRNDLIQNRLNLDGFGLLVFDETHRAVKDYAYTHVAKKYLEQCRNPIILAMTASPGSDKERIQQICENLSIEHIEYRSDEDSDVKQYMNPINLKWEILDLPEQYQNIWLLFKSMLNEKLKWLINHDLVKKNIDYIFKTDLIELGKDLRRDLKFSIKEEKGLLYSALLNQSSALTLTYCIELIGSQGAYSLKNFIKRMESSEGKAHTLILKDPRMIEILNKLENIPEHPKLNYISNLLSRQKFPASSADNKSISQVLIFTHYRDTATHIVDELNKHGISSYRFVGQSDRYDDMGMKQTEQSVILESFKKNEFNVLVATSIAEEGLDIPEVDLVIFYEPVASEIRYIQRKGRTGRRSKGTVIVLAAKDTIDVRSLYSSKRRIERMRTIFNIIKTTLKTFNRISPKPNPFTLEELQDLNNSLKREEEISYSEKVDFDAYQNQILNNMRFSSSTQDRSKHTFFANSFGSNRKVSTFRHILDILIKEWNNSNHSPLNIEHLSKKLLIDHDVLLENIQKLERYNILKIENKISVVFNKMPKKAYKTQYNIYVERISQGKAYVLINDRWPAILNYYDYDGPRHLLKKKSQFKAFAELYIDGTNFCIRIKEVISN